jgi:hypothetical protein
MQCLQMCSILIHLIDRWEIKRFEWKAFKINLGHIQTVYNMPSHCEFEHIFNQLNPWIVSAENLKFCLWQITDSAWQKSYTNDCFNALRQGNHHCQLSNSQSNLWHSTPNINNSGHNNLGSKFSVVMTKKALHAQYWRVFKAKLSHQSLLRCILYW